MVRMDFSRSALCFSVGARVYSFPPAWRECVNAQTFCVACLQRDNEYYLISDAGSRWSCAKYLVGVGGCSLTSAFALGRNKKCKRAGAIAN